VAEDKPALKEKPYFMALSWNNRAEEWEFPVLPPKVTIQRSGTGQDYRIIGGGPIRTIEKPGLAEISFDSFFPMQRSPFVTSKYLREPHKYVNYINKWMHSGYPVRFTYVGSNTMDAQTKIWIPATIASFERWEEAGSPGDIFFSLKLKEYAFYAPHRVMTEKQPDGTEAQVQEPNQRWDPRVPQKTYKLKTGDSLMKVAKTQLGDAGRWRELMELNKISWSDMRKLPIGMVLQLPERR